MHYIWFTIIARITAIHENKYFYIFLSKMVKSIPQKVYLVEKINGLESQILSSIEKGLDYTELKKLKDIYSEQLMPL